jgi:hypothetical protein
MYLAFRHSENLPPQPIDIGELYRSTGMKRKEEKEGTHIKFQEGEGLCS